MNFLRFPVDRACFKSVILRFYTIMKDNGEISKGNPEGQFSWADAGILAGAVLGILMGISLLSVEVAAGVGILILLFVIFKLLSTKS